MRWFEVRSDPPARHGGGQPVERAYGDPWAYVVGFAGLPLAFVLAVAHPFGGPRWVYGGLIFLSALPGWNMVQAWAEEGFPIRKMAGLWRSPRMRVLRVR